MRLHHVQVACPPGGEDAARLFYVTALGLTEEPKPEALRGRGGVWLRDRDAEGAVVLELHVGVEDPFSPARKAHPALLLDSVAALDAAADRLVAGGFVVDASERDTFPGHVRLHTFDATESRRAARRCTRSRRTHTRIGVTSSACLPLSERLASSAGA